MALHVAHGTYTGNNTDNTDITVTPSFAIQAVFIKSTNAVATQMSFSGMGDKSANLIEIGVDTPTNRIQSMGTGTFQVGNDTSVNGAGVTYYYTCLGGDSTEILASNYTGNATDNTAITAPGFLPELVIIIPNVNDGSLSYSARWGGITGDQSFSLGGAGGLNGANFIQSLDTSGFTIGNDLAVNTNLLTYYYLAIRNVSGQSFTSSYTGNATDLTQITAPNFQPSFVLIKGPGNKGIWNTPDTTGGQSLYLDQTAINTNGIESLLATGFQIGTDVRVNTNLSTYYYYTLKDVTTTVTNSAFLMFMGSGQPQQ